jgi:hypothetical protein
MPPVPRALPWAEESHPFGVKKADPITVGESLPCRGSEEKAMKHAREKPIPPEMMLGILAMRFRGTRDEGERDAIAQEYAAVVARLIDSGKWKGMPTFEN